MALSTSIARSSRYATPALTALRQKHYKVAVVGGGAGGLAVSSTLSEKLGKGSVAVIEPSKTHFYQPGWTLVGGGLMDFQDTQRSMGSVMPKNVDWIHDGAATFAPEENAVTTQKGDKITYDYLVVASGMYIDWNGIKGLAEAVGKDGVTSNYHPQHCQYTSELIDAFEGGNAYFTQPNVPIKCAGAPQKIMYIFEDKMRRKGVRDQTNVTFMQGMPSIFAIQKYAASLTEQCQERGINVNLGHVLKEVKPATKEAVFQHGDGETTVKYDFLHAVPPMRAPDFIAKSPLAAANGYVDVDQYTMQHNKYTNVFAIGDCANVPTSKTAAAVADESRVVKANLLAAMENKPLPTTYEGYASCPLVMGVDKLILAEFSAYTGQPQETFPFNQAVPRKTMFHLKKDAMPEMYFDQLLTGHWEGPGRVRKILNPLNL
eukprot:TRINITY_DN5980_c0_g1_i1.p1 TRINITY_DN5980_c0_g1~~TRINITY_DN5980_c0_g1_i1.p1  ORF type:complete len:431 (+),score=117.73 TRINITY_DN5980_c0_g1_i1:116-1408(+)